MTMVTTKLTVKTYNTQRATVIADIATPLPSGMRSPQKTSYARCKRKSIEPGATPQVYNPQSIVALQAQK